jgi:hypothetical protein
MLDLPGQEIARNSGKTFTLHRKEMGFDLTAESLLGSRCVSNKENNFRIINIQRSISWCLSNEFQVRQKFQVNLKSLILDFFDGSQGRSLQGS